MKAVLRHRSHLSFCFLISLVLIVNVGDVAMGQGFPGHWKARWIWTSGETHRSFHYFLMARHDLSISGTPRSAALDITAFDRYMLYVNGEYLGRGPARSDTRWKSYDRYDVGSHLRPGKNTIAVLAYHYGMPNGYTRDAPPGLFVQLEIIDSNGLRQIIGTDDQWRVRHALGWRRMDSHDYTDLGFANNGQIAVTEVYNANLDPPNWQAPDFDDSQWEHAYVIPESLSPSSYLEPRQTPLMRETEVAPVKVVKVGEVLEMRPTSWSCRAQQA
jgi:alpha-L-rhamnosidase